MQIVRQQIFLIASLLAFFALFLATTQKSSLALGLGETNQVTSTGVYLSDGYGGPLASAFQIAELGSLISHGFNQETTVLAMLLQELGKKSLDTEALLKGIGEYFSALEILLKNMQKNTLTLQASYANKYDSIFGKTPFHCSDHLTASAMREAKKNMRNFSLEMKANRIQEGEGTQDTESKAENSVAVMLHTLMAKTMTKGNPDEQKVPSSSSMFPFSGVLTSDGGKIYQAIIHAINSQPTPIIRNAYSISGRRALELQGIKMGRIAGIQEGLQISFDLQNPVINGHAFSEMQYEVNKNVEGESIKTEDYIEGARGDSSGGISILQALTHQFERSRIANPDWYAHIDNSGINEQGLLRELIKLTAWRGYLETQNLRINMVNAYNLAQISAILMEKHDNARMASYIYPPGESPTQTPKNK